MSEVTKSANESLSNWKASFRPLDPTSVSVPLKEKPSRADQVPLLATSIFAVTTSVSFPHPFTFSRTFPTRSAVPVT